MNHYVKTLCIIGSGLVLATNILLAKEKSALEIIDKAFLYTAKMDKYAFQAKIIEYDVKEDGSIVPYYYDTLVQVDRPDKLHVKTKSKLLNRNHYINNGLYSMMDYTHKTYGQFKVPKNIDKALDVILKNFDVEAPLASLVYSDMEKRIKFESSEYLGEVILEGVACDYVTFKVKDKEVHVWVTKEASPRIKAYETINTKHVPHKTVKTSIVWIENPKITDSNFNFVPAKGSEEISLVKSDNNH